MRCFPMYSSYPNSDHSPFLTVYHGKSRGNKTNGNFFLSFVLVDKEKDIQREEVSRLIEFWVLSKIFSNTRHIESKDSDILCVWRLLDNWHMKLKGVFEF
jgi:hypothetical protein